MHTENGIVELNAGALSLRLGRDGRILRLGNRKDGRGYDHPERPGYLVRVRFDGDTEPSVPVELVHDRPTPHGCRLTVHFTLDRRLALDAEECDGYLRLRIAGVDPAGSIACVVWGPVATTMEGPIGEYLGLLRDDGFAIGMLSLGMHTEGRGDGHNLSARRHPVAVGGSFLELETWDWSRDRPHEYFDVWVAGKGDPRAGLPGAGIALYGCEQADILDTVEAVELAEDLPHPRLADQWAKRSAAAGGSSWWMDYTEENIDRCLDLVEASGFRWLCRFRSFGNWGHFDPDPDLYPNGFAGFKVCSDRAEARGVHVLFYTLSTFTKAIRIPEPYITPTPDPRLQTVPPPTRLMAALDAGGDRIRLAGDAGMLATLERIQMDVETKVLRIGNELIRYQSVASDGDTVLVTGCERGFYGTQPAAHQAGARVDRMLFTYWDCFFPGTEDMNAEIGRRIGELALKGNFRQVMLDGHEGCRFTGHGAYSQNVFLDAIYRSTQDAGFLYSGSNLGNWSWHALSYISWGEYDCHKGFRGGMLDYRLWRMIQLQQNLMPRRFGQHYPDRLTTVEDIEWLMALAAGWDAGVELHVAIDDFNRNPDRDRIVEQIRLWEQARLDNVFSEDQKQSFRQTDRLHTIRCEPAGWNIRCLGRWRHPGLELLPANAIPIRAIRHGAVADCSVAYDWTHDPGIYQSAWLSDDMAHDGGGQPAAWEFTPPPCDHGERSQFDTQKLQVLIRLPETAPRPIRNLRVTLNGDPECRVLAPVELAPGHYLSTPHDMPMAFVYDVRHEVVAEVPLRDLPPLPSGPLRVEMAFDGTCAPGSGPVLNLRTHRHIPLPKKD